MEILNQFAGFSTSGAGARMHATAIAGQSEELKQRIVREGVVAQQQYRNRLVHGCTFQYHYGVVRADGRNQEDDKSTVVLKSPARSIETMNTVSCINDKYGFDLSRRGETQAWSVTEIVSSNLDRFFRRGTGDGLISLTVPQRLLHDEVQVLDIVGIPIEELLTAPLMEMNAVETDDEGRVVVKFSGSVPTVIGIGRVLRGTIWLSPEKYWAVDEYVVEVTSNEQSNASEATHHRKVEWTEVGGFPVPLSVSTKSFPGGVFQIERRYSYSEWEFRDFSADRFRLRHYGFPEPGSHTHSATTLSDDLAQYFAIKEMAADDISDGTKLRQHFRLVLVNRLGVPVTLLGASKGCSVRGCCEALNLPKELDSGAEFELEVQAEWRESPERALPLHLFTSLGLTGGLDFEVLPNSVCIQLIKSDRVLH